ncbi:hypothetical protein [Roseivirga pacifica]
MKSLKFIVVFLFFINSVSAQGIPSYYFDIEDVLLSPYTLYEETNELNFNFRALSASQEGHFYLVIEKIKLGGEGNDESLLNHFYLRAEDFSLSLISEVELFGWISKYKFLVKIGQVYVYEIDVSGHDSDKIKVTKMK